MSPSNYTKKGIPFIRTSEIKDPIIDFTKSVFISNQTNRANDKTILYPNDLVFTKIGAFIGDVGILPTTYGEYNFSQNVAGASLKNKAEGPYLLTFFLSSIGRAQILRSAMLSGQGKLELNDIRNYKIPIISKKIKDEIDHYIRIIEEKQEYSLSLYEEAENLLLINLGIDKNIGVNKHGSISVKKNTDVILSNRFDAEYYQPKYDDLFEHLKKYSTNNLSEIVSITKSIEPGSEAYKNEGTPFLRVANLSKYGLSDTDIYIDEDEFPDMLKPQKDTILLSKDGSVGIAYKAPKDMDVITSGAILHLSVFNKKYLPDYLTLVLNSFVVRMQAERDSGGSIIQHWKPSEIEKVIIPKLDMDIQLKISNKVQESFRLRTESKRLLDLAKTAVEVAIEQGESKAMECLTNKIKS